MRQVNIHWNILQQAKKGERRQKILISSTCDIVTHCHLPADRREFVRRVWLFHWKDARESQGDSRGSHRSSDKWDPWENWIFCDFLAERKWARESIDVKSWTTTKLEIAKLIAGNILNPSRTRSTRGFYDLNKNFPLTFSVKKIFIPLRFSSRLSHAPLLNIPFVLLPLAHGEHCSFQPSSIFVP